MDEKLLSLLVSIEARLNEINAHLVYLCHVEEEKMKREPSAFSYVRDLEVDETAIVPYEKLYAVSCAVSYLEVEYERTFSIKPSQDGNSIVIKRIS